MKASEIGNIIVSCLENCNNAKVTCNTTLSWVLSDQCFGSASVLERVREFQKFDKKSKEYRTAKMAIGGVTVSCMCVQKRDAEHVAYRNPLICIDIDKDDNPKMGDPNFKDALLQGLFKWKYVYAAGLSCSGNGIYLIVYLSSNEDDDDFLSAYNALEEDLKKYDITVDDHCTDITRLRMASPYQVLIKTGEVEPYEKRLVKPKPETFVRPNKTMISGLASDAVFDIIMDRLVASGFSLDRYDIWFKSAFALHAIPGGYDIFLKLSLNSPKFKGESDVIKKWEETKDTKFTQQAAMDYMKYIASTKLGKNIEAEAVAELQKRKSKKYTNVIQK